MTRPIAVTRPVPDSLAACELTHLPRAPIDVAKARTQHQEYEHALRSLGCEVKALAAAHDQPDSVFVEDTAIVLDEVAILARPGAASRRGEIAAVADALSAYRQLHGLAAPATLDGGDVLRLGRTLYVGIGGRTNEEGASQLSDRVAGLGYTVRAVPIGNCLHLKSAVTGVAAGVVLLNPDWVDPDRFAGHDVVEVHPSEPYAGNVLRLGRQVLCAAAHVRTNARLEAAGYGLRRIDVSELAKAEGAITCCSLVF